MNLLLLLLLFVFSFVLCQSNRENRQPLDTAECDRIQICNGDFCALVCEEGSVKVDDWAVASLNFQRLLQRDLPLLHYELPGTHNGYQTQHRGYGVEEDGMHQLFTAANYTDNYVCLANQRYSVTDQLNFGVRWIEVDIWWTFGYDDIRCCHDPMADPRLIYWVERAANETNEEAPQWDPSQLGCYATHNENLATMLNEVNDWLLRPGNEEEFVIIYYDTKTLFRDDSVELAVLPVLEIFGDRVLTPVEWDAYFPGRWPTANEIIELGKQIIVENQASQFLENELANSTIFTPALWNGNRGGSQFGIHTFEPFPACTINGNLYYGTGIARALDTSIQKGPAGQADPNRFLYPEDIRNLAECGITTSGMDNAQPIYTRDMIWSWKENEPSTLGCTVQLNRRWQINSNCTSSLRHACQSISGGDTIWTLSPIASSFATPTCPTDYFFSVPRTGYSNSLLSLLASPNEPIWIHHSNIISNISD